MKSAFENEVAKRFGVLPNFFRLGSSDLNIAKNLWGFAQFAYLDNALPSLFKERLFVYLSRFCEIRYCIARHVGFLAGLGYPAGDASCLPQEVECILPLLRRPLPQGEGALALFTICAELESPLRSFPEPDSPGEQAIFACATHVFLQSPDAAAARAALKGVLGPVNLEQLNLLLAFVRTAHYWTLLHPELVLEEDVQHLLATHEALAACILKDAESSNDSLTQRVAAELASLRKLREQHENVTQAYEELSLDHQYTKHHLQESEENLRELVSVMPAAVYACDSDGIITYYNRHAIELWGRCPDLDAPPWSFLDSGRLYETDGVLLLPDEAPAKVALLTGSPIVNRELVLERPDGSRINVLANISLLRGASGTVRGTVSIFQDISELKRAQRERESLLHELERSNRELSQFSYAVSHDLQAPVRSVRALTQILAGRAAGSKEDSSHVFELIERASVGMERLIESLLRYAQAGQGHLDRKHVSVDQIIGSVKATLSTLIAETGAQIICKLLPDVEADPILLEQLFQNLIGNALQYHRPGEPPVIEISGQLAGDVWAFAVRDNGEGVPLNYQDYVFEPLKRLHGNDTPGTGLGLALCRTIAARHGGRIWVESEGAGQGSVFRFTLAAAQVSVSIA
jgi:signal transduction histidine kinase